MTEERPIVNMRPGYFSTPERIRARLNMFYEGHEIMLLRHGVKLTPSLLQEYMQTHGEDGDRLRRMRGHASVSGTGTLMGLLGGAAYMVKTTRVVPLWIVGSFLTTIGGHLVGDDIGSWIYGTYKFDRAQTTKNVVLWAREKQGVTS